MTSIVQKATGAVNGVSTIAPVLAGVTAGNTLILLITDDQGADNTPTDSSGQTWGKAFFQLSAGPLPVLNACYYLLNAQAGTHAVTWTTGGATSFTTYALVEAPPSVGVNVVGTQVHNTPNPTSLSASVASTIGRTLVLGMVALDTNTGSANSHISDPPPGFTSIFGWQASNTETGAEFCYLDASAIGTFTAAWTFDADASAQDAAGTLLVFDMSGPGAAQSIQGPMFARLRATPGDTTVAANSNVSAALAAATGTGSAGAAAVAVDKPLTSVTGTASVGTIAPSTNAALTGVSGTSSAGTVSPSAGPVLTGVTGTGSAGATGVDVKVGLTGVSATGTAGTVTASVGFFVALTGVTGTGSVGTVAPAIDKSLAGATGTSSVGSVVSAVSPALTGNSVTGSVGTVAPASVAALTATTGTTSAGTVGASVQVALSGVTGTGSAGTVTAIVGGTSVALTGVSGTGSVSAPGVDIQIGISGVSAVGSAGNVSPPASSSGGNAWEKTQKKRRAQVQAEINARNLEIIKAELAQESEPEVVEAEAYDDDEDVLMLLL